MAEIKTAVEVFQEIKTYWEKISIPLANSLSPDLSWEEIREIARKCIMTCKDQTVDGVEFTCTNVQIEGNDQLCIKGTILDIYQDSVIRPFYKKFSTCARNLIYLSEGGPSNHYIDLCKKYCIGCGSAKKEKCIAELKKAVDDVLKKDGVFDQIIEKAKLGEWELATD